MCGTAFVNGFVRDAPSHMSLWRKGYLRVKLTIPFSDVVVANSRAAVAKYDQALTVERIVGVYTDVLSNFRARGVGRRLLRSGG